MLAGCYIYLSLLNFIVANYADQVFQDPDSVPTVGTKATDQDEFAQVMPKETFTADNILLGVRMAYESAPADIALVNPAVKENLLKGRQEDLSSSWIDRGYSREEDVPVCEGGDVANHSSKKKMMMMLNTSTYRIESVVGRGSC